MRTLFLLGFALLGILSFTLFGASKGAIQEAMAVLLFLGSIICLVAFAVCERLAKIQQAIERADRNTWKISHAVWSELRHPGNSFPPPLDTVGEKQE